ncbi:MAG: prolyl oligopeptidase family serine peptidase [Gemmataceae bacterium]|nr:prolyl oligopeptidase family serine peptidase [Gemmataceae bacterium]
MKFSLPLAVLLLATPFLPAADPKPDTARGDRMLEAYFRSETKKISDVCLADIKTKEDWEKKRPELRRQFFEMMGLWPLPPRTDLKATITGKVETDLYTVEKLHFQSSPGLYVTGNLYLPKRGQFPAPTILYVCGHGNTVVDKVSYGSKVSYQYHPAWFAEHGYVCLILDTLQLGEIQGIHHGTHNLGMWWWQTLGYTPAGIECWNAMRALDYLETRKEVDKKRFGVTGRSGGGATSWWLAAADDRVQCIVPVAGIADLQAHVCEGVADRFKKGLVPGHCDCMYFVNTYRWDFPLVAALCAPRPLMLGNSDKDDIFPVPSYRRLADKVRKVYDLYGAGDKFALLETEGPHKDTTELRKGINGWMNRWLKDDRGETVEEERPRLDPKQLKVFDRLPDDQYNTTIHETFVKPAHPELPHSPEVAREWWKGQREVWMQTLREQVFRGWPEKAPALNPKLAADVKHDGLRLRGFDFVSEENVELRLWLLTAETTEKPSLVVLNALDEKGWNEWLTELDPAFKAVLQTDQAIQRDDTKFLQNRRVLEKFRWGFAYVAPRGIGPTRWAEVGTPADNHIKRRFALLGQTLDGQRVWDVRRAFAVLKSLPELKKPPLLHQQVCSAVNPWTLLAAPQWKDAPLWLQGKGDMAGIVLYASLFEPDVARLDLWHPPASHRQGPTFLNLRRSFDMPQAMALGMTKEIRLYVKDDAEAKAWDWALQLQKSLIPDPKKETLKIRAVGK